MIGILRQNTYFGSTGAARKPAKKVTGESKDLLELRKSLAAHRVAISERKEIKRQKTILDFAKKHKRH